MKYFTILFISLLLILFSCKSFKSNNEKDSLISNFEWNFSKKKQLIYSFSNKVNSKQNMQIDNDLKENNYNINALITVSVNDEKSANLVFSEIAMKTTYLEENNSLSTPPRLVDEFVINGMNTKGGFKNPQPDISINLLFSLPQNKLLLGHQEKIPLQIPYNINKLGLTRRGFLNFNFKGFTEIGGIHCAKLVGIIDVSKLDISEKVKGNYTSKTTGKATYYFDLENKYFVGADIQFIEKVKIFSPVEKNEMGLLMGIDIDTESKNTIKIRLKEIKS